MKLHQMLAPLFAWVTLARCAQTTPVPAAAAAASEPESARLGRELRALIGPAACSADSQCRTLAVGAKACGGPAGYLAWSTQGTDAQKLTALAVRHADAQRRETETAGMRSNCMFVPDPGAACVAGRCELAGPNSAR